MKRSGKNSSQVTSGSMGLTSSGVVLYASVSPASTMQIVRRKIRTLALTSTTSAPFFDADALVQSSVIWGSLKAIFTSYRLMSWKVVHSPLMLGAGITADIQLYLAFFLYTDTVITGTPLSVIETAQDSKLIGLGNAYFQAQGKVFPGVNQNGVPWAPTQSSNTGLWGMFYFFGLPVYSAGGVNTCSQMYEFDVEFRELRLA